MTGITLGPADPPRDQWGRPLIKPVGGGKAEAYTRCTTFVGSLEDTSNLTKWKVRTALVGLVDQPHLALAVAAHRDDKRRLNGIAEEAVTAGGGSTAATKGTALHAFTEKRDRGEDLKGIPAEYLPDLDAYTAVTKDFEPVLIEQFVVVDSIKVAGTADRVYKYTGEPRLGLEPGKHYIGDVKTGSVEWGFSKIEMQLAVYAHGLAYDIESGERSDLPDVSLDYGVVIHLPAGKGEATLHVIPLVEAWDMGVKLAGYVKEWRKRKNTWQAAETYKARSASAGGFDDAIALYLEGLAREVRKSTDPDAIRKLWADNVDAWTEDLTTLAKARVAELTSK